MRVGATAGLVILTAMAVVVLLALGFGVSAAHAVMQALPLALAAGAASGALVALEGTGAR
ncbi:MAG TPA: hypothetical protein VMU89_21160 [Thermomicrobiaceae bacterium]|nr:hypothetical protein [Thermomicrobiaceae bacterium]